MEYTTLGNTGLEVSRICLGTMSYAEPGRGGHPWSMDEEASRPFYRQALDAGINFFDTANVYSLGSSEEYLNRLLLSMTERENLVIATKVHGRMRPGPNGGGLSRKAIMHEIDDSLRRLGTDYVDLYQIHRLDHVTPMEEILEALHDVVKAGKARYIGASSMHAWEFAKLLYLADLNGWTRFVSMQNHYNLLYREEEREMIPFCVDQGIGLIPWSPLARGRVARPWDEATARSETDDFGQRLYSDSDKPVVDAVGEIAEKRGIPRAQVGLAWMLGKSAISAPIVGATKPHHIEDAVASLDVELTDDEVAALEAPYEPHPVLGFNTVNA